MEETTTSHNAPCSTEGEYRINSKEVKIKLAFECSENFAKNVLDILVDTLKEKFDQKKNDANYTLEEPKARSDVKLGSDRYRNPLVNLYDVSSTQSEHKTERKHSSLLTNLKRNILILFGFITVLSIVCVGVTYRNYMKKNRAIILSFKLTFDN